MPILSFEKILRILEIICKILIGALGAIGVLNNAPSDSDEQGE